MQIRTKLLMLFLIPAVALAVNLLLLYHLSTTLRASVDVLIKESIGEQLSGLEMEINAREMEAGLYHYLREGDPADLDKFKGDVEDFSTYLGRYKALVESDEEREWAAEMEGLHAQAQSLAQETISLRRQQEVGLQELHAAFAALDDLLDDEIQPTRREDVAFQEAALEMEVNAKGMVLAVTGYLSDPSGELRAKFTDSEGDFAHYYARFQELAQSEQERAWAEELGSLFSRIRSLGRGLMDGQDEEWEKFAAFSSSLHDQISEELLDEKVQAEASEDLEKAQRTFVKALSSTLTASLSLSAAVLAVCGMVWVILLRRMYSALSRFLETLQRVEAGDLSQRVEVTRDDELARIGRAFNRMVEEIARSREELEEWSRTLEDRVAERTAELRRTQAQLIQAARLAAVGELIAGVAHELNNPLTAVMGYAQLLQVAEGVDAKARRDLQRIHEQAQRCATIVRNLLTFARRYEPEESYVSVNDLIQRVLDLRAYELRVSNIQVITELATGLPWTMADPHRLQQVFLNIVNNAQQAMAEAHRGGTLTVRSRLTGEDTIRLEFADDGPGIPPEVMPKIFDPFFTTKEVGQGTGLGLSICYGIVAEHGGRIWAESPSTELGTGEEGRGATFIIELPVREREAVVEEEGAEAMPAVADKRILVVEDEEVVAGLLVRILGEEGHRVETAASGERALQKIEAEDYDLIICDLKMPGMDGRQLYEELRAHRPEVAGRVIFATGNMASPDTHAFLQEAGAPVLSKPFQVDQVLEVVRRELAGRGKEESE